MNCQYELYIYCKYQYVQNIIYTKYRIDKIMISVTPLYRIDSWTPVL